MFNRPGTFGNVLQEMFWGKCSAGKIPFRLYVRIKKGILCRFTNNGVYQNGFQDLFFYTLCFQTKKGPIYIESNDGSEKGIKQALARGKGAIEFPLKRHSKKVYPKIKEHFPIHLEKSAEMAARAVEEAVSVIRPRKAIANGYYSAYERFFYQADSQGNELFHPATSVRFGVTITKGNGKGYLGLYYPDPQELKVKPIVEEAMELAESASLAEIRPAPGIYECIFSPRALLELIEPLRRHFDARLAKEGKSIFSGCLGKKVFSKHFSLSDDVRHENQFGIPFDAEGDPKKRVRLIQNGVLKQLLAEGHCTRGILEHPFYPENLVIEKGNVSLEQLFSRVRKGIFINKIWYHTLVKENQMEVTGLATAGSLYIEKGRILGRINQTRYHDSLFSIFNSVVAVSQEQILLKDGERGAALFPYLLVSRLKVV